jgi:hypothetical protein
MITMHASLSGSWKREEKFIIKCRVSTKKITLSK